MSSYAGVYFSATIQTSLGERKMALKFLHVYDLDGVLVDSSHRVRYLANGKLDFDFWMSSFTPENVERDILLPHSWQYVDDILNPYCYVVLCSVRHNAAINVNQINDRIGSPDKLLLVGESIPPFVAAHLLKRRALQRIFNLRQFANLPRVLWEDNASTIDALRDMFTRTIYVQSNQGA
jgi:hypothetical protein